MFNSVVVEVNPSKQLSSVVVEVRPSKQPSSVAVTSLAQIVLLSAQTVTLSALPVPSTFPALVANISAKSRPADSIPLFVDDTDIDSVVIWPLELKFPDTVNFSLPVPILI